ncbi:MAG TPA: M20/M25/M40 family metallo-hydrolase [Roseiflexaceae bacterium]|nr:M20/M25/M40 family metallo-hydrolase [Roseiflexaceae bacterium]
MIDPASISTDMLLDDLRQLVELPGALEQREELAAVASRLATLMRQRGLQTEIMETSGAPVVIGRRAGRSPFTLLLYHHYDTSPSGPWRAWHHDPFQLAERDGALFGRGVAHGKGPLVAHLAGIASLLERGGELPCGVLIVAEGEGLGGSAHLNTVVSGLRSHTHVDACLSTGGERGPDGRPLCYSGAKGMLQLRLTSTAANQPLPIGLAASVPNPLWRMLWALNHIKNDQEEILIKDFYNDVEGPSRSENQAIRSVQLDEAGRLAAWGLNEFLFSASGATLVRAEALLPTCNISSLAVEPHGEFPAIPVAASARLDFQLVPDQRPHAILDLLYEHLAAKGLGDIEIERLPGGYHAAHTPFDHPYIKQVRDAGQLIYGAPLDRLPLGSFAQPLAAFVDAFGIPMACVGCARPDSALNGPNEHIPLDDLVRHAQLLVELLSICAAGAQVVSAAASD